MRRKNERKKVAISFAGRKKLTIWALQKKVCKEEFMLAIEFEQKYGLLFGTCCRNLILYKGEIINTLWSKRFYWLSKYVVHL